MSQLSTGASDLERRLGLSPASFGLTKACYTVNECLTILSIGRTSLYALIKSGQIRPIKLGKKTLIGADDMVALLQSLRRAA